MRLMAVRPHPVGGSLLVALFSLLCAASALSLQLREKELPVAFGTKLMRSETAGAQRAVVTSTGMAEEDKQELAAVTAATGIAVSLLPTALYRPTGVDSAALTAMGAERVTTGAVSFAQVENEGDDETVRHQEAMEEHLATTSTSAAEVTKLTEELLAVTQALKASRKERLKVHKSQEKLHAEDIRLKKAVAMKGQEAEKLAAELADSANAAAVSSREALARSKLLTGPTRSGAPRSADNAQRTCGRDCRKNDEEAANCLPASVPAPTAATTFCDEECKVDAGKCVQMTCEADCAMEDSVECVGSTPGSRRTSFCEACKPNKEKSGCERESANEQAGCNLGTGKPTQCPPAYCKEGEGVCANVDGTCFSAQEDGSCPKATFACGIMALRPIERNTVVKNIESSLAFRGIFVDSCVSFFFVPLLDAIRQKDKIPCARLMQYIGEDEAQHPQEMAKVTGTPRLAQASAAMPNGHTHNYQTVQVGPITFGQQEDELKWQACAVRPTPSGSTIVEDLGSFTVKK